MKPTFINIIAFSLAAGVEVFLKSVVDHCYGIKNFSQENARNAAVGVAAHNL